MLVVALQEILPHGGALSLGTANVEGWLQVGELGLAFALAVLIGLERELRHKDAGLRTHTLVGVGAGLFMLLSKYGFSDVLEPGRVVVDPSRVAAQIVTGIGFIGAGLIFVRHDGVRGLTTAASIWVTAAVGATAGAGLPILAVVATAIYLVVTLAFPPLVRRLPASITANSELRVRYPDGQGLLRKVLAGVTDQGFSVGEINTEVIDRGDPALPGRSRRVVEVSLTVRGRSSVHHLAAALSELPEVEAVVANDVNVVQD